MQAQMYILTGLTMESDVYDLWKTHCGEEIESVVAFLNIADQTFTVMKASRPTIWLLSGIILLL